MDTIDSQISSLVDELADAKWDDLVSDEDCEEFIARLAALGFKRTSNRLKSYMDNDKKCGGGCANYEADYNDL